MERKVGWLQVNLKDQCLEPWDSGGSSSENEHARPVHLALKRLRQENHKSEGSLSYKAKQKEAKKDKWWLDSEDAD